MFADSMKQTKMEKLKELKELMYQLMSDEGVGMDDEISKADVKISMQKAVPEEMYEGEMESKEMPDMEGMEMGEDSEMEEKPFSLVEELKKDFYKNKKLPKREGTAMIIAGSGKTNMEGAIEKAKDMLKQENPNKFKSFSKGYKGRF